MEKSWLFLSTSPHFLGDLLRYLYSSTVPPPHVLHARTHSTSPVQKDVTENVVAVNPNLTMNNSLSFSSGLKVTKYCREYKVKIRLGISVEQSKPLSLTAGLTIEKAELWINVIFSTLRFQIWFSGWSLITTLFHAHFLLYTCNQKRTTDHHQMSKNSPLLSLRFMISRPIFLTGFCQMNAAKSWTRAVLQSLGFLSCHIKSLQGNKKGIWMSLSAILHLNNFLNIVSEPLK